MLTKPLKNYQLQGLNWLYTLHTQSINGILADESTSHVREITKIEEMLMQREGEREREKEESG